MAQQQTFTAEQFWAELEAVGEDVVRQRLIGEVYGSGNHKRALAVEWVRKQESARESAAKACALEISGEQLRLAKRADMRANIALIIAGIALLVSIVTAAANLL